MLNDVDYRQIYDAEAGKYYAQAQAHARTHTHARAHTHAHNAL